MPVTDPFRQGLERGWITHDGSRLEQDLTREAGLGNDTPIAIRHQWVQGCTLQGGVYVES